MGRVFFNTRSHTHELTTGTYQCLASDSNKSFMLNTTGILAITLPADADIEIGWNARFVMVTDATATAITIKASAPDAQNFIGGVVNFLTAASAASAFGSYITSAIGDTNSQIALDHDLANNEAAVGTDINITKTAANTFFVSGVVATTDADGTGGAIFSDI